MLFLQVEDYLYESPKIWQKLISYLLLPFSIIYTIVVVIKDKTKSAKDLGIPVVSIGNLLLGGTGKTPFTISLASNFQYPAIVLRGYKRESKGCIVVSHSGTILTDIKQSGDEAMLYAKSLLKATVIVAEDREEGVLKAKELGSEVVFLDDGFRHKNIKKYDILLRPTKDPKNSFCLPSGGYKMPKFFYNHGDMVLKEGVYFRRETGIEHKTDKMTLVTAIARPLRLNPYLPKVIRKYYYPDHHTFTKKELTSILLNTRATSLLVTEKDAVKMSSFNLPLSILKLKITIDKNVIDEVKNYIKEEGNN